MLARDIMHKRVLAVRPETTLLELIKQLSEHGISGAPVVGPEGDLIGVVSQTDVIGSHHAGVKVASVMTPWTVSLEEDTDIKEVVRQMLAKKIHRVIITREGRMCGIITSMDLIRAFAHER